MSVAPPKISSDFTKLAELIADVRVAFMTTFPDGAAPHARPMYTHKIDREKFDGVLWFMTDAGTPKLDELKEDATVLLTYAVPDKNRYIAVNGRARVERNPAKAKELWNIHAKGWWPGGPDDPRLRLIEVQVDSAEYWDGPSNTSYMLSLLKAVVTGSRVQPATEHGSVQA